MYIVIIKCATDRSVWTSEFEVRFYHPILLAELKLLRRERRNLRAVRVYAQRLERIKYQYFCNWKNYLGETFLCPADINIELS